MADFPVRPVVDRVDAPQTQLEPHEQDVWAVVSGVLQRELIVQAAPKALERTVDLAAYKIGDAGYLSHVQDWSQIDVRATYGYRKTADGFAVDKIPGPDGKTYSLDMDRTGTRQPPMQVWEVDPNGNKTAVTDRSIIKSVSDAGNKLFDVRSAQNIIEDLGLSEAEQKYVGQVMSAIKSHDTAQVEQLIKNHPGDAERFGDLFIAMFCKQSLLNMDDYHVGYLNFPGGGKFNMNYPAPFGTPGKPALEVDIR